MKSTGIFRKVDILGRVVIPAEIRNNLGININESMEIYVENRNVVFSKNLNFSAGIHRKFDKLGRIVIPSELRESLDIRAKDSVEILIKGKSIVLKKYSPQCIFCGEDNTELIHYREKNICVNCVSNIKKF